MSEDWDDPILDRRTSAPPASGRTQAELIVRIDERTNVLLNEIRTIKETTVTKAEFTPVRSLVFGLVALIMSSVVIALVSLVVVRH